MWFENRGKWMGIGMRDANKVASEWKYLGVFLIKRPVNGSRWGCFQ